MMRSIWSVLAILAVALSISLTGSGCGNKPSSLDTAAPPVKNPESVPAQYPGKAHPPAPPTMNMPPKGK
jgi:hypothetical protein